MKRIIHISDTHGVDLRKTIPRVIPEGSLLVHSGDFCNSGTYEEAFSFFYQLAKIQDKFSAVIVVPGNHDIILEEQPDIFSIIKQQLALKDHVHCLINEDVTIDGYKFFGAPTVPRIGHWAFMKDRSSEAMLRYWSCIPKDIDFLISHGPPYGILDVVGIRRVGCEVHRHFLSKMTNLKANLFGHVHESYGMVKEDGVMFSNGSTMNWNYDENNLNPANIIYLD